MQCKERVQQLETCFHLTSVLSSQLNLENVLDTIMSIVKKVMKADACTLMLVDKETGELVFQIALSEVGNKIKELGSKQRLKIGEGIAGTVAKTGKSLIIKDAYKYPQFNPAYDKQTGFQTGSILCAPMKVKKEIIGVCQVIHNRKKGKVFIGKDLSLFNQFCKSAALAIQNARSHHTLLEIQSIEKEMEFALSVQQSFFPQKIPEHDQFAFAANTIPARVVGGDFYDFITINKNKLGIVIGDVSGKGISAALQMSRLMSDFRFVAKLHPDPSRVLKEVNNILYERSQGGMFTTAIYLLLDMKRKTMRVANGGHPSLLLRNSTMKVVPKAKAGGPPLGILPNTSYPQEEVSLKSGDRIFLYTDGVTEPKNRKNNYYGEKRLRELLKKDEGPLEDFFKKLKDSIQKFIGSESQHDDLTILTFQVL